MSDPVASALLLIVAIAYLVGAFVVITALAKVLSAWSASWRTRGHAGPVDDVLQDHAATAMAAVAALANVTPPATHVVAYIGTPTGDDARTVGDGGLAVTRFRAGHPATVVFAQAALTGLSPAAGRRPKQSPSPNCWKNRGLRPSRIDNAKMGARAATSSMPWRHQRRGVPRRGGRGRFTSCRSRAAPCDWVGAGVPSPVSIGISRRDTIR